MGDASNPAFHSWSRNPRWKLKVGLERSPICRWGDFRISTCVNVLTPKDFNLHTPQLFGGKDAAITSLNNAKIEYGDLGHPKYNPDNGEVRVTGAQTFTDKTPPLIIINTWGSYRNTTLIIPTPGGIKNVTADFGTGLRNDNFRALMLLHELGHIRSGDSGFKPDGNDAVLNRAQTQKVLDACFPGNK